MAKDIVDVTREDITRVLSFGEPLVVSCNLDPQIDPQIYFTNYQEGLRIENLPVALSLYDTGFSNGDNKVYAVTFTRNTGDNKND